MSHFKYENFETASHSEELDFIFNREQETFADKIFQKPDFLKSFKLYFRLFKKRYKNYVQTNSSNDFTNIIYLTADCPPYTANSSKQISAIDYIKELRNQYPNNDIRLLIPIINVNPEEFKTSKNIKFTLNNKENNLIKTPIHFEFFMQNRYHRAVVYKFPKTDANIEVYGIFSPGFSYINHPDKIYRLHYLAPFMKSARIAVKKLASIGFKPDIVHSDNLPFLLGEEFEQKNPSIKFIQSINDVLQIDNLKSESFWAVLNLADKKEMQKLCSDNEIKKGIATLFNLHNSRKFPQMKECLNFIYKNYYRFRKFIDKGEDIEENVIFNRLNKRATKLFPQLACLNDLYFNPYLYSFRRSDKWVTSSKTYYEELFSNENLSGSFTEIINKTKEKSGYVSYGYKPKTIDTKIYKSFDIENFRDNKKLNKAELIKNFSEENIKTNLIDPTLFKDDNYKIVGCLDSFYPAPLLFANPSSDIFANGIDIIFNSILKQFELHKSIQVILCIKDGLKHNFIQSWINFLDQNKYLNGKFVFIDGSINPDKFYAGSDIILIPRRSNIISVEHFDAMKYGCVPVVSKNGILNDTISDIFDDINLGCGFKTKTSLMTEEDNNQLFLNPFSKALSVYQNNPGSWNLLVKNCLNNKSDWDFEMLEKYNELYII